MAMFVTGMAVMYLITSVMLMFSDRFENCGVEMYDGWLTNMLCFPFVVAGMVNPHERETNRDIGEKREKTMYELSLEDEKE